MMTRNRRPHRIVTSAVAALGLILVAISPALAHHNNGPKWGITAVATPGTVSVGDVVAFNITISNLSDSDGDPVHLVATTPAGSTFLLGTASAGLCTPGASLDCALPLITLGASSTAQAIYRVPASGSTFAVTFSAHTDDPTVSATASATLSSDPNVASRYVWNDASKTVSTDQAIGAANPQSTLVKAPTTGIVVSASEGAPTSVGPAPPRPCFGQESEIHVGGGATYPNGFKVVLKLDASEIPHGVYWWNIGIAHQFDNGTWETLSRCMFACFSLQPNHVPCFYAVPLRGGDIQVTIFLTQNGKLRGF